MISIATGSKSVNSECDELPLRHFILSHGEFYSRAFLSLEQAQELASFVKRAVGVGLEIRSVTMDFEIGRGSKQVRALVY
jgi:hypothetical protein